MRLFVWQVQCFEDFLFRLASNPDSFTNFFASAGFQSRHKPMITQSEAFFVCQKAHTPIKIVTSGEVQQCEAVLLFWVDFHVYATGESLWLRNLADTHV